MINIDRLTYCDPYLRYFYMILFSATNFFGTSCLRHMPPWQQTSAFWRSFFWGLRSGTYLVMLLLRFLLVAATEGKCAQIHKDAIGLRLGMFCEFNKRIWQTLQQFKLAVLALTPVNLQIIRSVKMYVCKNKWFYISQLSSHLLRKYPDPQVAKYKMWKQKIWFIIFFWRPSMCFRRPILNFLLMWEFSFSSFLQSWWYQWKIF